MLQRGAPKLGKDGKPMKDKHGKVIYEPYRIKVLNTINFKKSMHYNPFAYIHSEKDILKLVTTLIANTKGEGKAGDDFWVKAETLLYCALIGYIHYEAPVEEQNFSTLIEFINAMEVCEDDEEFKNPVDLMFDALESEKPNHFAVRQYKKYKLAAGAVSLKRLLNQSNLKSWSSKMIKKSLEAYFFTLKNKIVFCKKQFQKHVRILFRQYRDCVRNFKKMTRNQKRCSKGAVKRPLSISFSVRIFFTSYTNLENETVCP